MLDAHLKQKEKPQNCVTTKHKLWKFNGYLNTRSIGMEAKQVSVAVSSNMIYNPFVAYIIKIIQCYY